MILPWCSLIFIIFTINIILSYVIVVLIDFKIIFYFFLLKMSYFTIRFISDCGIRSGVELLKFLLRKIQWPQAPQRSQSYIFNLYRKINWALNFKYQAWFILVRHVLYRFTKYSIMCLNLDNSHLNVSVPSYTYWSDRVRPVLVMSVKSRPVTLLPLQQCRC
jgi:hypothetical protein